MKKFIAALIAGLLLIATPAASLVKTLDAEYAEHEDKYSLNVFVTAFYDEDYANLVSATSGLQAGDTLTLTIMSQGGPAIPCIAMVEYLLGLKAKGVRIITDVAGLASSAAAVLWMTGDERHVSSGDMLMFHTSIITDMYGRPVPKEKLPPDVRWVIDQVDYFLRQFLLNVLRDTEKVNEILGAKGNKNPERNEHWYTGLEVFNMGIATHYTKTL